MRFLRSICAVGLPFFTLDFTAGPRNTMAPKVSGVELKATVLYSKAAM